MGLTKTSEDRLAEPPQVPGPRITVVIILGRLVAAVNHFLL